MARKIKSIMQDKEAGQCYLCCLLHKDYSIKTVRQEHHVIGGTANRKLSEKYGLKVWLDPDHHLYGQETVHKNAEIAEMLHKKAQKTFMRSYPELDFCATFGKNYLTESELNELAYLTNTRFKTYVNRYCKSREMTTRDVLEHKIVTDVRL